LGSEIEVVEEGILLMAHIHKGGIEARGHLAHFGEEDVAHGEPTFSAFAVQLAQDFVPQEGNGHLSSGRSDDELVVHAAMGMVGNNGECRVHHTVG
jgi:hypothetical protein